MQVFYILFILMKKNTLGGAAKSQLGRNIKMFRVSSNLTQEELAEKAGISVTYLGAIERGEKWPGPETLSEIARTLKVELYCFFTPESPSSREVRKIVTKLATDISALVNESVKMLNTVGKDSGGQDRKN